MKYKATLILERGNTFGVNKRSKTQSHNYFMSSCPKH